MGAWRGDDFSLLTISPLPSSAWHKVQEKVELIDVLWLQRNEPRIGRGFEVEQSTAIYSGILRMKDLALSLAERTGNFYLVAPESREEEVMARMARPALYSASQQFRLGYGEQFALPSARVGQWVGAPSRSEATSAR